MVLLLGKMLCSVVNPAPLSSHLLSQKTFSRAVKSDIFKESQTVFRGTHQKLSIARLLHEELGTEKHEPPPTAFLQKCQMH